jgi:phage shock protein A
MGLLSRIFRFGKSEANSVLDKFENPIKLLKLKITEMEDAQGKSVTGLAKVKTIEIGQRTEAAKLKEKADTHLSNATKLKKMMKSETIDAEQAKKDILLLLNNHENFMNESKAMEAQADKQKAIVENLEQKVVKFKTLIKDTKNKIVTLEAQREAAKANKEISKELSTLNVDGVENELAELERRITSDNNEASAWESLDESTKTDEERINALLEQDSATDDNVLLKDFLND